MSKLIQKNNDKLTLIEQINALPKSYFAINDLKKVTTLDYNSLKVSLSKLVKSQKIVRIARGYYAVVLSDVDLEAFSLEYYGPSYLSFEWALGYYGILSQQSYGLTLATVRRGREVDVKNSSLIYRHIQKKHFWGFVKVGDKLIAEPEKAFLDQVYLSLNGAGTFDIEEMNLDILDKKKLKKYLKRFDDERLGFRGLGV
jgi:predicted transcriptional regulator of viral defense system